MGIASKKWIQVLTFAALLLVHLMVFLAALCRAAETEGSCNGSISECYRDEEIFMESETSRRILAEGVMNISYEALHQDRAAAAGAGAMQHRPYFRDCSPNNGCRTQVYNG
ncbi:hypothetical protein H6P81_000325 [Aristolochia fimbriata]|uniref:Uncharacterized protein n=1 Tax=Aristolochia fimbriata TaxID=158543 RepID=A0AAV7F743_ARIFI|nr:hypothetical protein H6P81_000325 [Aristolochia fimbriata]